MTITDPTTSLEVLAVPIRPTMRAEVLAASDELRHMIDHLRPALARFHALNIEGDQLGHRVADAAVQLAGGVREFGTDGAGAEDGAQELVYSILGTMGLHALLAELSILADPDEALRAEQAAQPLT